MQTQDSHEALPQAKMPNLTLFHLWLREATNGNPHPPTEMKDNLGSITSQAEAVQKCKRNGDGLYQVEYEDGKVKYEIFIYDGMVEKLKHLF